MFSDLYSRLRNSGRRKVLPTPPPSPFKKAVEEQRCRIQSAVQARCLVTQAVLESSPLPPINGRYDSIKGYHRHLLYLQFVPASRGWKIEGRKIIEGHLAVTGEAYWVEQERIGDPKILVTGWYNTEGEFSGTWMTARKSSKSFEAPAQHQTLRFRDASKTIDVRSKFVQEPVFKIHIAFETLGDHVVISSLPPRIVRSEDSSLRVGMTVAMINDQKVVTAEEANKTAAEAKSFLLISAFRGVYEADRHSKLVSASIVKETEAVTKTGLTLKRHHGMLCVANIAEGSPWSSTNLAKGMRIWAINEHTSFRSSTEAAQVIRDAGSVTILAEDSIHFATKAEIRKNEVVYIQAQFWHNSWYL